MCRMYMNASLCAADTLEGGLHGINAGANKRATVFFVDRGLGTNL